MILVNESAFLDQPSIFELKFSREIPSFIKVAATTRDFPSSQGMFWSIVTIR